MSFWKFNFSAPAVDSISSILAQLPESTPPIAAVASSSSTLSLATSPSTTTNASHTKEGSNDSTGSATTTKEVDHSEVYDRTLDRLLSSPDLLSELKTGQNSKLNDFIAHRHVVLRIAGWIVWGLGRRSLPVTTAHTSTNGLLSDDLPDGKVPDDFVVGHEEEQTVGMGNVKRRRDMNELGELQGPEGETETEQEKAWALFPRLCTEILSSDSPKLSDILFNPSAVSTEPHTCPDPKTFLLPFWETLLSSTELQLETRSAQVGYWTRVNATLLNGDHQQEVLSYILTIPHLLPRLLALLPYCSPLNDLLLLLLRISTRPSPLIPSVVTQSIRMLDPFAALGKEGHSAAEDLLRGCIELGSATVPPPPNGPGPTPGQPQQQQELELEWRDNSLTRQIAEEKTVRTLLDWVLPNDSNPQVKPQLRTKNSFMTAAVNEADDSTPKIAHVELYSGTPEQQAELKTSSLIASIAVFVDLIRKNNSDFVEQHMLTWARKREAEFAERELLESQGAELIDDGLSPRPDENDRGPPVVDLTAMLSTVSERIGGLQELVRSPRSAKGQIVSTVGPIQPVTLERFRICEFYAELLHCSNMGLLNRPIDSIKLYDQDGYLAKGWKAADDLAEALQGPIAPEDDYEYVKERTRETSPIRIVKHGKDKSDGSYSGTSTPSAHGSLDSESGILTREEARELRELIASAGGIDDSDSSEKGDDDGEEDDDDGKDPFGDPDDDADLEAATSAIQLDEDLNAQEPERNDTSDALEGTYRSSREATAVPESTRHEEEEEDDPKTPHAPSVPPLPRMYTLRTSPRRRQLPPGPMLKRKFMEHDVIETMLDMFFQYPWNNLIHNVTFDLLQQIFHGRIDRALDRQLALSVFMEGKLIDRILRGHEVNEQSERATRRRLGYMGHMILIAEEIVKLFEHYHEEIYQVVESSIPQPDWDRYVSTTLRETRERDLSPLGGGISNTMHDTSSVTSALSDEDDEFPMNSARAMRAMEANPSAPGAFPIDDAPSGLFSGAQGEANLNAEIADAGPNDQFSRYLVSAISGNRTDKFASSDEDDDDEDDDPAWIGSSADPGEGDFALGELSRPPKQFGFDDRFESAGRQIFQSTNSDSDDDGEWGAFSSNEASADAPSSATTKANELLSDDFHPTVASSSAAGFGSSFADSFGDSFTSSPAIPSSEEDEDDFGDFEEATTAPTITLPSLDDSLEDFDFGEEGRRVESNAAAGVPNVEDDSTTERPSTPPLPAFGTRPGLGRVQTIDDGSAAFGSISTPTSETPPATIAPPSPKSSISSINSPPVSPGLQADLATSDEEPLGHGASKSAHLTEDGFVEAVSEVDGKTIRVPADEVALAHRRASMDGQRPTKI